MDNMVKTFVNEEFGSVRTIEEMVKYFSAGPILQRLSVRCLLMRSFRGGYEDRGVVLS